MPGLSVAKPAGQRGAGLIEVAIALLLLCIGTLGLGSLQIAARRVGLEAVQRSEAAALAMDLLERMRANRADPGAYSSAGLGIAAGARLAAPAIECDAASCSPAQLKNWDLWQWEQALDGAATGDGRGGLVRPAACITIDGRRVTVAIAWQGFRGVSATSLPSACGAGNYGPDDADRQSLQISSWIGGE